MNEPCRFTPGCKRLGFHYCAGQDGARSGVMPRERALRARVTEQAEALRRVSSIVVLARDANWDLLPAGFDLHTKLDAALAEVDALLAKEAIP